MNLDAYSFKAGALKPMACLREGWQLIKQDYWLFLGITVLGMFVANLAALILLGPLMCGIHYCYLRQERGQGVSVNMLFRGFDYFAQSLIATLIQTAIFLLPTLVMFLGSYIAFFATLFIIVAGLPEDARNAPPEPGMFLVPVLMCVTVFTISSLFLAFLRAFFIFTYPLIVDRRLDGWDAVKLSVRAAYANLRGAIGLTILIEIVGLLGLLACYFGMFLALPIVFAMLATAYRQVFDIERPPLPDRMDDDEDGPLPIAGPPETGIQEAPSTSVSPTRPE